ncbi:hypothetical protein ACH5RR_017895 [Cinchona calisaya]|uniref:Glutaredoxin-like protein n=1 Tax=Cinchona calisaya TaxID=153742 RepID=A0ABD2ZLL9_9GENT
MGGGSVKEVKSKAELEKIFGREEGRDSTLLGNHGVRLQSRWVEADEQPEISEAYLVAAVPYFVFFKVTSTPLANKVAKVAGSVNAEEPAAPASLGMAAGPTIHESVKDFAKGNSQVESHLLGVGDGLKARLEQLVDSHPVMLFMKGSPEEPKCGFSQKGELLGDCDIAIAMHENGELKEVFYDHGIEVSDSTKAGVTEPGMGKGGIWFECRPKLSFGKLS